MSEVLECQIPSCINVPKNRWEWHWKAFERARFPSYRSNQQLFLAALKKIYTESTREFEKGLSIETGLGRVRHYFRTQAEPIFERTWTTAYENTAIDFAKAWQQNLKQEETDEQDIVTLALLAVRDFLTARMFSQQVRPSLTLRQYVAGISGTNLDIVINQLTNQAALFLQVQPDQPLPPVSPEEINKIALRARRALVNGAGSKAAAYSRISSVGGANIGLLSAAMASGQQLKKMWLSQRDAKVRDTHVRADGDLHPLNGLFNVGGSLLAFPGDWTRNADVEEIAGCRCVLIFFSMN